MTSNELIHLLETIDLNQPWTATAAIPEAANQQEIVVKDGNVNLYDPWYKSQVPFIGFWEAIYAPASSSSMIIVTFKTDIVCQWTLRYILAFCHCCQLVEANFIHNGSILMATVLFRSCPKDDVNRLIGEVQKTWTEARANHWTDDHYFPLSPLSHCGL